MLGKYTIMLYYIYRVHRQFLQSNLIPVLIIAKPKKYILHFDGIFLIALRNFFQHVVFIL